MRLTSLMAAGLVAATGAQTAQQPTHPSTQPSTQPPNDRFQIYVGLGWSNTAISGNANKFFQYATPPRGFYLERLDLRAGDELRNDARLVLKAIGQPDYRAAALVRLNSGGTILSAADSRARFFDTDPFITDPSSRRTSEFYVNQKLTPTFDLFARTRLTDEVHTLGEPLDYLDQSTRTTNVSLRGSLWRGGFVDLGYTDLRYEDRTAILPDTHTETLSAGALQEIGDSFALSGAFSRSITRQPGSATDRIDEWNLGGNLLAGDDTNVLLSYRNTRLEMPTVLNAYDRSRQEARARIVHRLGAGWNLQVGYDQLALERVTSDHTFVDVPRLHTLDAEFSGRLSRSARLTGSVSHQTMQGGAQMQTLDPRALYWTSRWDAKLKFDAFNERANVYGVLDWHQNRNSQRDTSVTHQGLTIGAEWSLKPELQMYSEISTDLWSGRTSDPLAPDLNSFFPDATTFTLGANWSVNPKTSATANYTFFNSQNDNPLHLPETSVWSSAFTGTLRYRASKDLDVGVTVAPWQFVDMTVGSRGYSSTVLQFTARGKF